MRKINFLLLIMLFGALVGCNQGSSEELESLEIDAFNGKSATDIKIVENYNGKIGECGEAVYEFKAGSNSMDAGDVVVSYDETYLYVKVTSTAGFQDVAENVKMWIGTDLNDLPTSNGSGAPINGQFPYKANVSGNTHVFQIALADIDAGLDCDEPFFIVVHGDVLVEYNGQTSSQTAYAGDKEGAGNRWWWYMDETVECCDEDYESAWLYKTTRPEDFVECFDYMGDVGISNEIHYTWLSGLENGTYYPLYLNLEDCSNANAERIGDVYLKILDSNTENPKIQLDLEMFSGFNLVNSKIYVGWENPLDENGNLKNSIIFENVLTSTYSKHVMSWSGQRPEGPNPPFYVIMKVNVDETN